MKDILTILFLAGCSGSVEPPKAAPVPVAEAPKPAETQGSAEENIGPEGPPDLAIPAISVSTDAAVVEKGKAVFDAKGCGACHQFGSKLVGPDLNGIGERREAEWIARMIKHSSVMVKRDPVAKKMFRELMVEMPSQGVADEELSPLVSFLVSHPAAK